jgi:hypothetical protein
LGKAARFPGTQPQHESPVETGLLRRLIPHQTSDCSQNRALGLIDTSGQKVSGLKCSENGGRDAVFPFRVRHFIRAQHNEGCKRWKSIPISKAI